MRGHMDKKWSIMDKKDVSDKCCQMENAIWNIFQSPSSWINGMNGFIRLVSMDGTWYHHRATDVFIPMAQNYINRFYRLDTRPERGAIRVRSGHACHEPLAVPQKMYKFSSADSAQNRDPGIPSVLFCGNQTFPAC